MQFNKHNIQANYYNFQLSSSIKMLESFGFFWHFQHFIDFLVINKKNIRNQRELFFKQQICHLFYCSILNHLLTFWVYYFNKKSLKLLPGKATFNRKLKLCFEYRVLFQKNISRKKRFFTKWWSLVFIY